MKSIFCMNPIMFQKLKFFCCTCNRKFSVWIQRKSNNTLYESNANPTIFVVRGSNLNLKLLLHVNLAMPCICMNTAMWMCMIYNPWEPVRAYAQILQIFCVSEFQPIASPRIRWPNEAKFSNSLKKQGKAEQNGTWL
jgi:hypothetical protein